MKILNFNDYKYVGRKGDLHCFISIRRKFDPEIIWLKRAKIIKSDGSFAYLDPIIKQIANEDISYSYDGLDSDGDLYHFDIKLDSKPHLVWNKKSAVCVNQPVHEERIPKRKLVRSKNLIKTTSTAFAESNG